MGPSGKKILNEKKRKHGKKAILLINNNRITLNSALLIIKKNHQRHLTTFKIQHIIISIRKQLKSKYLIKC